MGGLHMRSDAEMVMDKMEQCVAGLKRQVRVERVVGVVWAGCRFFWRRATQETGQRMELSRVGKREMSTRSKAERAHGRQERLQWRTASETWKHRRDWERDWA
jgi:hypothetical protein